jgi:hypothetical protein
VTGVRAVWLEDDGGVSVDGLLSVGHDSHAAKTEGKVYQLSQ